MRHGPGPWRAGASYLGFDSYIVACGAFARTLWLLGHPAQAVEWASRTIQDAADMDHAISLSFALLWTIPVFLWVGDHQNAEQSINSLISVSETHSLGPFLAFGIGFRAQLAIHRGDAEDGVESLRNCLTTLRATGVELLTNLFSLTLVQGLAAIGQTAKAIELADETIQRIERNGDLVYMPEGLRVKGRVLLAAPNLSERAAELCFTRIP